MAVQSFIISTGFMVTVRGYALGPYRPLWLWHDGQKSKNPGFDSHSQHVLNLKFPNTAYYQPSATYCEKAFLAFVNSGVVKFDQAEIVIVPSSAKGRWSEGLERIAKKACKGDKRLTYRPGALYRHTTIEKLAKGGDRSLDVHLNSLGYKDDDGAPPLKILLDDVYTSGNSIRGAMTVMEQVNQGLRFLPVVLSKTTHD